MKRPFIVIFMSFAMGILISNYIKLDFSLILILIIISIIFYILFKIYNIDISIFIMIFFLGISIFYIHNKIDNSYKRYLDNVILIEGTIENYDKIDEEYTRYILKMKEPISEKLLLTTDKHDFQIGDNIKFKGELKIPESNTNPKLFNYNLYLKSKNIKYKSYIETRNIEYMGRENSILLNLRNNFQIRVKDSFNHLNLKNSELLESMIVGNNIINEEDKDRFRDLGLAHILAISGLHISIITGFVILFLSFLKIDRKLVNMISIFLIILYIYIVGYPPSILRAGISLIIYLISINIKKYSDSINNIFFLSFILSIYNPYIIYNLGFQLSIIASISIITIPRYIKRIYYLRKSAILNTIIINLSVQIGLLPIQIYYFNYINLISIIGNLLIIPIISLALPLGFILVLLGKNLSILNHSLTQIINILLDGVFKLSEILSHIKLFEFKFASPELFIIICYYIFLLIIFRIIRINFLPKSFVKIIVFFLLFTILLNTLTIIGDNSMKVDFIDVDQGDCILISYRNKNFLIDTGGNVFKKFDIGKNIVIPYLEKHGINKLDIVFLTHFDYDHGKSLPDIMDVINIDNIVIGYRDLENELYNEIIGKSKILNIPIKLLTKGDIVGIDDNIYFKILGPNIENINLQSKNDISLVIELNYYNRKILFTGDIEERGEKELNNFLSKVDFLKIPHHGSKTSSSIKFLDIVKPSYGFIQVGKDNPYSHPNMEVLERYRDMGTIIYRTDLDGRISIKIDGNNYSIDKYIKEKYSIIEFIDINFYRILSIIMVFLSIYISILIYEKNEGLDKIELHRF